MGFLTRRSASTSGQYIHDSRLERKYDILKRKYNNLSNLYVEAKRQIKTIKKEFDRKSTLWKEWSEWWTFQKNSLRTKSVSPAKEPNIGAVKALQEGQSGQGLRRAKSDVDVSGRWVTIGEEEVGDFRTTFSPDTVAERQDMPSFMSSEITFANQAISRKGSTKSQDVYQSSVLKSEPLKRQETNRLREDDLKEAIQEAQETPKLSNAANVLRSATANLGKISALSTTTRPFNPSTPDASPRPISSPSRQPLSSPRGHYPSTRTSEPRKKKRDYPSMKFYTEDGTDGVNPRAPSPTEEDNDDGGLLVTLLEGLAPETPEKAIPISTAQREILLLTPNAANAENTLVGKQKRARELIEIDSDSGSGDSSTRSNRKKRTSVDQVRSRTHPGKELLSPDLAIKNKGRGRYSTSLLTRYFPTCTV